MATVERLLDALTWVDAETGGKGKVVTCHPTTSSNAAKDQADHDLVVETTEGQLWFEVSDVLQPTDGNRKLMKEEISLRIRPNPKAAEPQAPVEPSVRRFLVTSPEWAKHAKLKPGQSSWRELHWPSGAPNFGTRIWEYEPATT